MLSKRTGRVVAGLILGSLWWSLACAGKKAKHDPKQTTAYRVRLAQSQFQAGRVNEALALLDEAIRSEPRNAGLFNYSGQICFVAGRQAEAERRLLQALEIDAQLTDAHNTLGAVYSETGRKDEAEREFKRVLEDPVYPTPEKAYLNLGTLYVSQGREQEALGALRRAVEINPRYLDAHYQLAALLDKRGNLDEAAREYEVAGPGYRNNGEYHYRLGLTYVRLGEQDKARESLRRALAVSPGSPSAAQAEELLKTLR
ncbi:MAG TPA: tetratricopeptide repeat protein [Candidatus Polarisedimenticolaceae bacterium]|nr:tetratricopeptide repeat protein [Candidatus Polarisedimenticolaceae bacterium]